MLNMDTDTHLKTDKERAEFLAVVKEITHELHAIETSRDQIKEIIDAASATFKISKGYIRKLSRFYHNKKFGEFESEAADLKRLMSELTTPASKND